jgi:hypothetical protein
MGRFAVDLSDLPELARFIQAQDRFREVQRVEDPEEEEDAADELESAAIDLGNRLRGIYEGVM